MSGWSPLSLFLYSLAAISSIRFFIIIKKETRPIGRPAGRARAPPALKLKKKKSCTAGDRDGQADEGPSYQWRINISVVVVVFSLLLLLG